MVLAPIAEREQLRVSERNAAIKRAQWCLHQLPSVSSFAFPSAKIQNKKMHCKFSLV
jgi:hypothetical protein